MARILLAAFLCIAVAFTCCSQPAKRVGPESINSFEAIKYDVGTTNDDPSDKAGYIADMDARDYNIVGSAWLTKDTGCILKYVLDFEVDAKDSKVSKTHYEGAVTMK